MQGRFRALAVFVLAAMAHGPARADDPAWRVQSAGRLTVDGGFVMAAPAALDTGFSTGVGAGAMFGRVLAWGLRASWSSATESSIVWKVTHADLKVRAAVALQHDVGRGRFALRVGVGPTIVREGRVRNQGMRAGLTGSDLETSSFSTLPAADFEGVVTIHVVGRWLLAVSGGPSLTVVDKRGRFGWTAQIGVGWQP
jgi:hypothetical protein